MINQGEGPPVSYLRFAPNGRYLLRATLHESKISLWDWQPAAGNRAAFTIKRVYTGGYLGGGCYALSTIIPGHVHDQYSSSHVCFVTSVPDRQLIATGDERNRVFVWDVSTSQVCGAGAVNT